MDYRFLNPNHRIEKTGLGLEARLDSISKPMQPPTVLVHFHGEGTLLVAHRTSD